MVDGASGTYQKILDRMADGVVLLDREGRYLYMNPAAERVLGSTLADAAGKAFWEAAPAALGTAFRDAHQNLLAVAGEELRIVRNHFAGGRWYEALACAADGEIFLTLQDVTAHLLAEAARLETEQRFRLLVDGVKDYAIFMLDLKGRVASWNSGAERIKGYRADEILGQHFSIFHTAEDVKRGGPAHALEVAATEGRYEEEGWRVRKDGSRFWASVVLSALRDESGIPRGFVEVAHDSTERRRAQDAEERRLLALDSAEIGTWEYFWESGGLICDSRCKGMFGLPPDAEVSYELIISGIHPADQPKVHDLVQRALAPETGGAYQAEYRTIGLRDGIERVIAAKGKVVFDEEKQPRRFLGTVRDVTDVRRTQQDLRASEERLRLATSAAHVGTVDYYLPSGELIWDSQSKALWGLPPDAEVTFAFWLSRIHADDRQRQRDAFQRAMDPKGGGVLDEEYRVQGRDGVERWIAVRGQVAFDSDGRALRFTGTMRDTSDLRRTQDALRESEERLRLALASADLGTWDYSLLSGSLVVDRRARELLGLADAELPLEKALGAVHPEDRPRFREVLDPGTAQDVDVEFRATGPGDRIERWIAAKGKVISDQRGRRARSLGEMHDVTERHRIDELRERLVGIFAHDLRTPVSAIAIASQMLLRRATLPDDARKHAATIARSTERMARMIRQLMDFTRVRFGGGMPVERQRQDLAALCRDAVTEAEEANPGRSVRYRVEGACLGMFDGEGMRRVMSNLLGNALEYGSPDRPPEVVVRGQDARVAIEVHSEGPPIPSELLPVLFDPFRRGTGEVAAASSRNTAGLGLGLYITREIVAAHGGDITVHSTKEEGTTFTVRLPRGLPASVDRAAGGMSKLGV